MMDSINSIIDIPAGGVVYVDIAARPGENTSQDKERQETGS